MRPALLLLALVGGRAQFGMQGGLLGGTGADYQAPPAGTTPCSAQGAGAQATSFFDQMFGIAGRGGPGPSDQFCHDSGSTASFCNGGQCTECRTLHDSTGCYCEVAAADSETATPECWRICFPHEQYNIFDSTLPFRAMTWLPNMAAGSPVEGMATQAACLAHAWGPTVASASSYLGASGGGLG